MQLNIIALTLLFISQLVFASGGENPRKDATASTISNALSLAPNAFATANTGGEISAGTQIVEQVKFAVFLGTFTYPLPIESEYCKRVRDVLTVTRTNIGYVYSVGAFDTYQAAEQYRPLLFKDGYEDADVISFYKSMPLLQANR